MTLFDPKPQFLITKVIYDLSNLKNLSGLVYATLIESKEKLYLILRFKNSSEEVYDISTGLLHKLSHNEGEIIISMFAKNSLSEKVFTLDIKNPYSNQFYERIMVNAIPHLFYYSFRNGYVANKVQDGRKTLWEPRNALEKCISVKAGFRHLLPFVCLVVTEEKGKVRERCYRYFEGSWHLIHIDTYTKAIKILGDVDFESKDHISKLINMKNKFLPIKRVSGAFKRIIDSLL